MPQLIKPGDTKIITKDGECHVSIALELTIKLDGTNIQVQSVAAQATEQQPKNDKKEETAWAIPDFTATKKLNFGKS